MAQFIDKTLAQHLPHATEALDGLSEDYKILYLASLKCTQAKLNRFIEEIDPHREVSLPRTKATSLKGQKMAFAGNPYLKPLAELVKALAPRNTSAYRGLVSHLKKVMD